MNTEFSFNFILNIGQHFFFPVSTCYLCRVSYDANKQLICVSGYKNKGGNFSALRLLVNYKALLKPTFYYQVSIMETTPLCLPSQKDILGLWDEDTAIFKTFPKCIYTQMTFKELVTRKVSKKISLSLNLNLNLKAYVWKSSITTA